MKSLYCTSSPNGHRYADGRPVLDRAQMMDLTKRILAMTSADITRVTVTHTARSITRIANDQVLLGDDGDELTILIASQFGQRQPITISANQLDDRVLQAMVRRSEAMARDNIGTDEELIITESQVQDTLVRVQLWHDDTVRAMSSSGETIIPELLHAVIRGDLRAAGFLGLMARSEAFVSKDGLTYYNEETDSELTATARTREGTSSGWSGQAARNWSLIRPNDVASQAVELARRGASPVAFEPGKRTAILSAAAVAQIVRFLADQYDATRTNFGTKTGFSRFPRGTKLGERMFDARIQMSSDPADPEGGYRPYFFHGLSAYGTPTMSWTEGGILENLAYNPFYAMQVGKVYADNPYSIRVSGGTTSVDDMIASCKEGIYVNRFSDVQLVDFRSGLATGVTRDGCFLVRNGKIDRPLKNFRFFDSPFFFLNRIEALGVPQRAALGYTPPRYRPDGSLEVGPALDWPRYPIIVPPMMVRDFNFSALADAV
jgi:predicted Zn-dependent protease